MKPFVLEAALAGAPVQLRDGAKAFVRHYETELDVPYPLVGFAFHSDDVSPSFVLYCTWSIDGSFSDQKDPCDIVGMWEEPLKFDHWDAVDPKWKYLAENANGSRWFYTNKPVIDGNAWERISRDSATSKLTLANVVIWDTKGRDWKETLIKRPE